MTIWEYADIFSAGWAGGDHQNAEGQQIYSYGSALNTFATQLDLVPEPATLFLLGLGSLALSTRSRLSPLKNRKHTLS